MSRSRRGSKAAPWGVARDGLERRSLLAADRLDAVAALDDEERAAAAFAAGEIEDEDAVPSLRDLLEDESLDVV